MDKPAPKRKTIEERIRREQREHLEERIHTLRYSADVLPEPAAVTRARKLVAAWNADVRKHNDAHERQWKARLVHAREAVQFKNPEEALAVVKKLEADAAKHRREKPECHC